jgi:hypothetical protein
VEFHLHDALFILRLCSTSKKKKQEEWKTEEDDNIKQNVSALNVTMDLNEQQIAASHTVFGQLRLESQVQILLRPQMFMPVFPHFQSVYSSPQSL